MEKIGAERRRHRRIYFDREQEITGLLGLPAGSDDDIQVKILNISEGGLFFIQARDGNRRLQLGETLVLKGLRGPEPFILSRQTPMEIKWVNDHSLLENIGYGCEFVSPPAGYVSQVRDMVTRFLEHS